MESNNRLLIGGVVLGVGVIILYQKMRRSKCKSMGKGGCNSCSGPIVVEPIDKSYPLTGNLYPLRHPLFCAREAAKHCTLLEDHLSDPHRDCHECERKHFLMAEGFMEEGLLMDRHNKFREIIVPQLEKFRECIRDFNNGVDGAVLAQRIREIRKPLCDHGFKYFS